MSFDDKDTAGAIADATPLVYVCNFNTMFDISQAIAANDNKTTPTIVNKVTSTVANKTFVNNINVSPSVTITTKIISHDSS